jgi:hypothetical protein
VSLTYMPASLVSKYPAFPKIPRWDREILLTEKIDGTNGLIRIQPASFSVAEDIEVQAWPPVAQAEDGEWYDVQPGSRNRWLTPESDNHGFGKWAQNNAAELVKLGPGHHFGEWYGQGINRGYGLDGKRFMLFNTSRWAEAEVRPACCEVATVLGRTTGAQLGADLTAVIDDLNTHGSRHVPGYTKPEGIVLFHIAGNHLFKVVLDPSEGKTADGYVIRRSKPAEYVMRPCIQGGECPGCTSGCRLPEPELAGVGA